MKIPISLMFMVRASSIVSATKGIVSTSSFGALSDNAAMTASASQAECCGDCWLARAVLIAHVLWDRAEMEQEEDKSRHQSAMKQGRAQQELDSRFGDAFGPSRQPHHNKRSRR